MNRNGTRDVEPSVVTRCSQIILLLILCAMVARFGSVWLGDQDSRNPTDEPTWSTSRSYPQYDILFASCPNFELGGCFEADYCPDPNHESEGFHYHDAAGASPGRQYVILYTSTEKEACALSSYPYCPDPSHLSPRDHYHDEEGNAVPVGEAKH